jgi:hypothetical protein
VTQWKVDVCDPTCLSVTSLPFFGEWNTLEYTLGPYCSLTPLHPCPFWGMKYIGIHLGSTLRFDTVVYTVSVPFERHVSFSDLCKVSSWTASSNPISFRFWICTLHSSQSLTLFKTLTSCSFVNRVIEAKELSFPIPHFLTFLTPSLRLGHAIDSGIGLSITIDKFRVFINKTLSILSVYQ